MSSLLIIALAVYTVVGLSLFFLLKEDGWFAIVAAFLWPVGILLEIVDILRGRS